MNAIDEGGEEARGCGGRVHGAWSEVPGRGVQKGMPWQKRGTLLSKTGDEESLGGPILTSGGSVC